MVEPEQSTRRTLDPARPARRRRGDAHARSGRRSTPSCSSWSSEHRSTIIFVNNRRGAERLALRLNELARGGRDRPPIARAHHGSLAREERLVVEELLKAGELPCLVATSSLELGIDMGAVDLVLQVESPKSVAARPAAHRPRRPQRRRHVQGPHLPEVPRRPARVRGRRQAHARGRDRADRRAAQPARRARPADRRDRRRRPRTDEPVAVDDLHALVTRTHTYAELSRELLENVLDMLDGRYPSPGVRASCARASSGTASPARSARARARASSPSPTPARSPTAACSSSRCPTAAASASSTRRWSTRRGPGRRSCSARRPGGSRRSAATASIVTPAPGAPGAIPFWKGDCVGRPKELGEAIGAFARWAVDQPAETLDARLRPRRARRAATCSTTCASSRRRRA